MTRKSEIKFLVSRLAVDSSMDNFDSQFIQLFQIHLAWGISHHVRSALSFREGNAIPYALQAAEEHHQAIDSQGDPAVRRRTELQGIQQETKTFAGFFPVD